jgi:hypothetical protein
MEENSKFPAVIHKKTCNKVTAGFLKRYVIVYDGFLIATLYNIQPIRAKNTVPNT